MRTAELLIRRLELIHRWYQGMVRPETGRLEYLYIPETDAFVRESSPIRDVASVWDVEVLGEFLKRRELHPLIERSLRYYDDFLVERDDALILDPERLEEPSSIAHSAFMILALLHAPSRRWTRRVAALASGILHQQRPDGSYKVYFHDVPDDGEELYAGEAMLALMESYRHSRDPRHLESVERGFSYYDAEYFRRGRVAADMLVFFANWQSQACRLLAESTPSAALEREVADYVFRMHDRILDRGFYEDVERNPARQASVEVACALEGLGDAYALARTSAPRAERYGHCICTGLTYLLGLQCTEDGTERERGGFGVSLGERAQRIDVTGHAASAFLKSVTNAIECPPTPSRSRPLGAG
ncbi:MAG TPA: hypothetical protein VFQ38_03640 [Longimicrobiales bacterium]|nr:hypothetical protein [Longimicrobiales bacterium]